METVPPASYIRVVRILVCGIVSELADMTGQRKIPNKRKTGNISYFMPVNYDLYHSVKTGLPLVPQGIPANAGCRMYQRR